MEVNGDGFLEELLSVGRSTWEAGPSDMNALFSSSWGFDGFYETAVETPAAIDSVVSTHQPSIQSVPNSYDCFTSVKPDMDCAFNEFYCPFEAERGLIDNTGFQQDYKRLEMPVFPAQEDYSTSVIEGVQPCPQATEIPGDFNMGSCPERRSKAKKVEGQPSKNLMAERRRRKRLNDRLSMLRSIVPKISKMDRTSILGDTIDYMKELLEKISNLKEQIDTSSSDELNEINIFSGLKENDTLIRNSPKFEVERRNTNTRVEICCSTKPGLLLSTVTTLDALGLEIQQCVISCFNDFSLHAACSEDSEQPTLVSSEDIKQALFRNAGYGGRCL